MMELKWKDYPGGFVSGKIKLNGYKAFHYTVENHHVLGYVAAIWIGTYKHYIWAKDTPATAENAQKICNNNCMLLQYLQEDDNV